MWINARLVSNKSLVNYDLILDEHADRPHPDLRVKEEGEIISLLFALQVLQCRLSQGSMARDKGHGGLLVYCSPVQQSPSFDCVCLGLEDWDRVGVLLSEMTSDVGWKLPRMVFLEAFNIHAEDPLKEAAQDLVPFMDIRYTQSVFCSKGHDDLKGGVCVFPLPLFKIKSMFFSP